MKKQSSLLNFFQKSTPSVTSVVPSQPSQRSDHIRKADEVGSEKFKSALPSEKMSQETNRESALVTPEKHLDQPFTPERTFNRLKRVKIDECEDDLTFNPANAEKNEEKKSPVPQHATRSTSALTALESFKSQAKQASSQKFFDDESEDSGKNKKSASKSVKKSTTSTPSRELPELPKPSTGKGGSKKSVTPAKGGDLIVDVEKQENNAFDYNDFSDATPEWAMRENCKDKKGRSPDHPEYDPTTLLIPPKAMEKLTPTMKQFWTIKSDNFDKILLFKLGKFYELFYEDALICHRELDLAWMGDKMHVGFPEKALDKFAYELVKRGYKVCVVEQMETPKQMEERLKKAGSKKDKTIRRELCQILSKGTFIDQNDTNHEPRYLLSVRNRRDMIGVAFLEIGTGIISLGAFKDDPNYTIFKMLVSQIRPSEVVYEFIETDPNIIKIMKNSFNAPVFSPLNDPRLWNTILCNGELEKYYGPDREQWSAELKTTLQTDEDNKDLIMSCFAGMISYLNKMLIIENVLSVARYENYDPFTFSQKRMVLDSQALQHLEILEVGYSSKNPYEGSLLHYVDKTVTPFGKRLMRKWVCAPLLSVNAINERLDAIEELESLSEARGKIRNDLKRLLDLERLCGRVYAQSVRKANAANIFEEIGVTRLREFKRLMESINQGLLILRYLEEQNPNSALLKTLCTFDNHEAIMTGNSHNIPDITPLQKELNEFIQWTGEKKDIPVPRPGVDQDYDTAKAEIAEIEDELTDYLKKIQARFNNNKQICFAHTKHRYEIEVPSDLVSGSNKPKDFEFSSKKEKRERFVTKEIKDFVDRLEDAEEKLKNCLNIFTCFFFSYFHKYFKVWDRLVEALSQLDCLCGLSMTSFLSDKVMCRPELFPMNDRVFIDVKNMRHPCVAESKSTFVSNDIKIGDVDGSGLNRNIILLTGPNMGGKSTILRQACIAAIMAQLGCYVPAEECRLSIVDRVFTRIGASDKLLEGKSTFYIEMEETLNILKYGSQNSLAIVDELGRGTSTFDGVSIAYAVLRHLLDSLKCRTLFATHYHVLLDEFRDSPDVSYYHMASKIDDTNQKVIFLYKLIVGECSNSFGLNIARLTGLPKDVMAVAKDKADEFEKNLNIREYVRTNKAFNKVLGLLDEGNGKGASGFDLASLEEALMLMNVE